MADDDDIAPVHVTIAREDHHTVADTVNGVS